MSDTPRTESECVTGMHMCYDQSLLEWVPAEFARELEREVNALRAMNAQVQVDLDQRNKDYENLQALM